MRVKRSLVTITCLGFRSRCYLRSGRALLGTGHTRERERERGNTKKKNGIDSQKFSFFTTETVHANINKKIHTRIFHTHSNEDVRGNPCAGGKWLNKLPVVHIKREFFSYLSKWRIRCVKISMKIKHLKTHKFKKCEWQKQDGGGCVSVPCVSNACC